MYSDKDKIDVSSLYGTPSEFYDLSRLQKACEERLTFKLMERRNHGKANKSGSNRQG